MDATKIAKAAEIHIDTAKNVAPHYNFDYSIGSLRLIDPFIKEGWGDEPPSGLRHFTTFAMRAYFAETIHRCYASEWHELTTEDVENPDEYPPILVLEGVSKGNGFNIFGLLTQLTDDHGGFSAALDATTTSLKEAGACLKI